jgi:hypothetical protein
MSVVQMQSMVHVHQCFNAVGHGTFFNGLAVHRRQRDSFSWIYDCGSKRTTRIGQEITGLERWAQWPEDVDLLVLSHFDDDHVNGVERLLSLRRVRVLALPYLDIGHRLAGAGSVSSEACSASTAAFQLDPKAWLQSRGLSGQVDTLLLVQGGRREDGDPPVDGGPVPLPAGPDDNQAALRRRSASDGVGSLGLAGAALGARVAAEPSVVRWSHVVPTIARGLPLELMFFNSSQPNLFRVGRGGELLARRSRQSKLVVQAEVELAGRRLGLWNLSRAPRKGWRDALRAVYVRDFGACGQQRNNISLCLLVRPLGSPVQPCTVFSDRELCSPIDWCRVPSIGKPGTLLLGDLRIDRATLSEMQGHFGLARWESLGSVQVPHHGSRHSWEPGAAAIFGPDRFIQCVPEDSSDHPHRSVTADLSSIPVLRADYRASVVVDYHFNV